MIEDTHHSRRTAESGAQTRRHSQRSALLRTLVLSILLGVVLEAALLLVDSTTASIGGLAQKTTRSFVICSGLVIGALALERRAPAMALAGLLAGPLGFYVGIFARTAAANLIKTQDLLSPGGFVLSQLALLKGLEYGVLGALLGWIGRRGKPRVAAYGVAGLGVGLVFGSAVLALTAAPPASAAVSPEWAVNELLFPLGCALVVFAAERGAFRRVEEPTTPV